MKETMADLRCGSCSAVAMETGAAALQAQIGSWKKRWKREREKKEIKKEEYLSWRNTEGEK